MQLLRRAVSGTDALKVVCRTTRDRSILKLVLNSSGRQIVVRTNTSDVKCLEKVFVDEEYRLPADINPVFAIKPRFIVDAGANIGMATLYFAQTFPNANIVAVEPEESNFELLRRNCEGIENIQLEKAALWSSEAKLQLADANAESWSFSVRPATTDSSVVAAINIPQILAKYGENRIDLLKLDIEGAERELFSESCEEWLPKVGMIVIELHDRFARGCSEAFYTHLVRRSFAQEIRGENIFIRLL